MIDNITKHRLNQNARLAGKLALTFLFSSIVGIALTLLLLSVNYASAQLPRQIIHDRIARAFTNGDLADEVHLRTNTKQGAHQFNDCLILAMTLDDRASAKQRALSPISPLTIPDKNPCTYLKEIVNGSERIQISSAVFYHNYIHGQVALTALLFQWLDLSSVRILYDAIQFILLSVLILLNFSLFVRSIKKATPNTVRISIQKDACRHSFLFAISVVLILFYGLQFYGMSLGHFPSDVIILLYLLTASFWDFSDSNFLKTIILHSLFGALTAYFELLTGGIPLGASLIFIVFAGSSIGPDRGKVFESALISIASYAGAIWSAFATKLLLSVLVFGSQVIVGYFRELHYRINGNSVTLLETVMGLLKAAHYLGAGWRLLGVTLLAGSIAAFAISCYGLYQQRKILKNWQLPTLLIFSFLTIVFWYGLFRQHSFQHNFFMIRISVGLIASSFLLLCFVKRNEIALLAQKFSLTISNKP